jgi:hypothetical protein
MRPEQFIPQFEDETKGYQRIERTFSLANLLITFITVGLVVTASIAISTRNDIGKQNLKTATINLQYKTGKSVNTLISEPTVFPTNIPQFVQLGADFDDDIEDSIRRLSKYPTHHPRKPKSTSNSPISSLYSSLFPITIVNDDFIVTPIVVVNSDINPNNTLSPTPENTIMASLQNTM